MNDAGRDAVEFDSTEWDEDEEAPERGAPTGAHSALYADPLYGMVRLSWWAAALVATPPFQRLAGISLSDVPGELLFQRPFPSRLDHALGVYHLARLARPRDRALQAAALAHDLGHGPFSHLTEPLMRDQLGTDHEVRSAALLEQVRAALSPGMRRRMEWLDWDDVAALVQGGGREGRGALLNGRLDYDNIDNVARFLLAGGLGNPAYDSVALARGLRVLPPLDAPETPARQHASSSGPVYLLGDARGHAEVWQAERRTVYNYLHQGHRNLAAHAMLRKATDLAAAHEALPLGFLALTDDQAFSALLRSGVAGVTVLGEAVANDWLYQCVWEGEAPAANGPTNGSRGMLDGGWHERLALESRLAAEAGFAEHEVILEPIVSSAERGLPPVAPDGRPEYLIYPTEPAPPTQVIHVFAAPGAPRDYIHRLRTAVSRYFGALGITERPATPV